MWPKLSQAGAGGQGQHGDEERALQQGMAFHRLDQKGHKITGAGNSDALSKHDILVKTRHRSGSSEKWAQVVP